ncbi:hypothetical protein GU926_16975 [Nibribacter ruber]|uniref:Uncharacterized protein n=1 Tax=Nibribacter ruber TaxID=2698458 RepID=A0A6P1P3L7_9BACT|nr:hypothetical protein [Nibribacter ruber]QHL89027.1 hypothetical protein GU926_16975 [Nibribacter ruber]
MKQAQEWFEAGQPFVKASPANKKKKQFPPVLPQWEKAREVSDKTYYLVEAPVKMETKLAFKLQGTDTAPNGITKLIILKNKVTGKQISALMHAFSAKGVDLTELNYRNLPKDFSGTVIYTSLEGWFVNGYGYENGKIVSSIKASEQSSGSRTYCNSYGFVEIWERTCTVNPDGPDYCSAPYFVGFEPVPICITVYDELSTEGPSPGSSGGSSDDGGYIELIDVYENCRCTSFDVSSSALVTHQKTNCVYNDLGGNTVMQNLISSYLDNGGTINLTYKVAPNLTNSKGESLNGQCQPTDNTFTNIVITINSKYVDGARTLEVARTILHESVHAKIFSDLRQIKGYENLDKDNFPILWETYVNEKKNGATLTEVQNKAHHEEMAQRYIDLIAQGLQQFDVGNHNNLQITLDHYKAFAWGGLKDTYHFKNNKTVEEKNEIDSKLDFMQSWTSLTCVD